MYIAQKNDYSCAPVAIYNAIQYFLLKYGWIKEYRDRLEWLDLKKIEQLCRTDKDGTETKFMLMLMRCLGFDFLYIANPSHDDLIKHEGSFILMFEEYWESRPDHHAAFFEDILTPINYRSGKIVCNIDINETYQVLNLDTTEIILIRGLK